MKTNGEITNGDGNHKPGQFATLFGSDAIPISSTDANGDQMPRKIRDLEHAVSGLTVVMGAMSKAVTSAEKRIEVQSDAIVFLVALVEKAILPLAESNRVLMERDSDQNILSPVVQSLALILDRNETELSQADRAVSSFVFIEECRSMDKQEIINLLQFFGVEQFTLKAGTPFDPATSAVKHVRTIHDASRHGKVSKVLRPGYRRVTDGWVIRPAWVEVFGPNTR
jgi:hypothetical protein